MPTGDTRPVPIADHALIGDRRTAALVTRGGSIDWLCLPHFDSHACFCAILGDRWNGRWLIGPAEPAETTRSYVDGTMILQTVHRTAGGAVRVTDVMTTLDGRADVIRRVQGLEGRVRMHHEWIVRFGYGAIVPWIMRAPDDADHGCDTMIRAVAGPDMLILRGPILPEGADLRHVGSFEVAADDDLVFDLAWTPSYRPVPDPLACVSRIEQTREESERWLQRLDYDGPYADDVRRSVLVLRALTDVETGGIVAAPTTSLPEELGGERNWDYRFCWLRDAAYTIESLIMVGLHERATLWRDWLLRAIAGDPADMMIMYRIDGGRDMPERELDHLRGYAGSRPVRIGNAAAGQHQADVLGTVMMALAMMRDAGLGETADSWNLQCALVDDLVVSWDEPDHGLWEVRGPVRRFTHSRVMVWVALDRAVRSVEQYGLPGPVDVWRTTRDEVRRAVLDGGYNAEINAFTQHDETTEMDASLLVMPLMGFIDARDPRFVGTVERIERDLMRDGLLLRYRTASGVDGVAGDEHPFLVCSFWLVAVYALMGRVDDAHALMDRLVGLTNDVGLLSEEYDPAAGLLMGNFPQAFSHLGLVHAAAVLAAVHAGDGPVHPGSAPSPPLSRQGDDATTI